MARRRVFVLWMVLIGVFGLLAGACSSDDDGGSGGDEAAQDTAGDDTGDDGDSSDTTGAGGGGDCAGLDVTGNTPDGEFTATTAYAVPMQDGAAWTLYLADFDFDPSEITAISNPTVPEDGTLFMVSVTVFNAEEEVGPIEPPTTVAYTDEFGVLTFVVQADGATGHFGNNIGAEGTVEITAVGDSFCGRVDYSDDEKDLSGSFEAEAVDVGL